MTTPVDSSSATFWSAEFWSSIAAAAAALAACGSLFFQRRSAMDAVRPDLLPEDWNYQCDGTRGQIRIGLIRNIGNGPAMHAWLRLKVTGHPECDAEFTLRNVSHIPVGEQRVVDSIGWFDWPAVSSEPHSVALELVVEAIDLHDTKHEAHYYLIAERKDVRIHGVQFLCEGLGFLSRRTVVKTHFRIGLQQSIMTVCESPQKLAKAFSSKFGKS